MLGLTVSILRELTWAGGSGSFTKAAGWITSTKSPFRRFMRNCQVFDAKYEAQVRLMLRCLPEVGRQSCFALKGGTAINLFLRDLPRISVDVDLTYLPLEPRDAALAEISDALLAVGRDIEQRVPGSTVQLRQSQGHVIKLVVATGDADIKIEPNLILRGTVYPHVSGNWSRRRRLILRPMSVSRSHDAGRHC